MDKKILRKQMIKKRNMLDEDFITDSGKIIFNKILSSNILNYNQILLYASFGNEVPTAELTNYLLSKGRRVFLPKCDTDNLTFDPVEIFLNQSHFSLNKYGIKEPDGNYNNFQPFKIDCAIIPGVAFDAGCNRIGFGAGYYDKFLKENDDVYKIGICYEFQIVYSIDFDIHDVCMDVVITEKNTYYKK